MSFYIGISRLAIPQQGGFILSVILNLNLIKGNKNYGKTKVFALLVYILLCVCVSLSDI